MMKPTLARVLLAMGCLGVALILITAVTLFVMRDGKRHADGTRVAASPSEATAQLELIDAVVPDVPLPQELPFVGEDGIDIDGYPTKSPDAEALLALLHARRYEDLTRYLEAYRDAFQADAKKELWLLDAIEGLASPDPRLAPNFDAWVAASPASFAPYAARGMYHGALAQAYRGEAFVADTAPARMEAMEHELALAWTDLDRALELAADTGPLLRMPMELSMLTGDRARIEALRTRAERTCPTCVSWRVTYLRHLSPRWGGSFEAMQAFEDATVALASENPRLAHLQGYARYDQAELEAMAQHVDAAAHLRIALRFLYGGPYWYTKWRIADLRLRANDSEGALADALESDRLRPGQASTLTLLLQCQVMLRRWEDASETAMRVVRLDPREPMLRWAQPYVADGLVHLAYEQIAAGDVPRARHAVEIATALAPRHAAVVRAMNQFPRDAEGAERVWTRLREAPDAFDAYLAYDAYFARLDQWQAIVDRWDAYLVRHPEDTAAMRERAGTLTHLGRLPDALAGAERACQLGDPLGCHLRDEIRAHMPPPAH